MRAALVIAVMLPAMSPAAECIARSGPTTAALVELYTSEGCSSCPPADRWLSKLRTAANVVPVAFHVTYWDYIGWRDPFARERYTMRQRERASASGTRYVYTPQITVGGRDFREWSQGAAFEKTVERINRTPSRADVEIRVKAHPGGKLVAEALATLGPGVSKADLVLSIAATQSDLSSRVTAGENRGAQLRHDFVVRDFQETRTFAAGGTATASLAFSVADEKAAVGFAAFVQNVRTGEVLQAVASPPCGR